MKNGSIDFVAVMVDRFMNILRPYANYEYYSDGEDKGFTIRETARKIIKFAEDKKLLKKEREDAKDLRKKILGYGNSNKQGYNNRESVYFKNDN